MSTRETVLAAVETALKTIPDLDVRRNVDRPTRVDPGGLAILLDGDPGEPEVTLSPLRYHFVRRAEIEAYVQAATGRDATLDTLLTAINTALAADRTFGGTCDWSIANAPVRDDQGETGAPGISAATFALELHYDTTDPLGG